MSTYKNISTFNNIIIREFDKNINSDELKWHRDLKNRKVTILEGKGWFFQKDNELPIKIDKGSTIFIDKLSYHRIIKGNTLLRIKIEEID
jgi:hypothetical protein